MRAPVRMLDGRRMVVIVVFCQVDVRRRKHRSKHHRRNEQRCGGGPANPGGNHAGILSGEVNKVSLSIVEADLQVRLVMEFHLDLPRDLPRVGVVRSRK